MFNNLRNNGLQWNGLLAAAWLRTIFLFLIPSISYAQCPERTTMGKDFWLMFLSNHNVSECSLMAACSRSTVIHVSSQSAQWDTTVITSTIGSVRIDVPSEVAIMDTNTFGIHVTSDYPIALYASNFINHSYDIATIYPTSTLHDRYMVQTYNERSGGALVGFVAIEDSTILSMVLPNYARIYPYSTTSIEIIPAGPHSVTLMSGETYQLRSPDFSGMEITSNGKPFAVFQGSPCTEVGGCDACDHLYEQCYPVDYWGNNFMLVSTATRLSGDLVQITSLENDCSLFFNGTPLATIQAGESYLYDLPANTAGLLHSTKQATVSMYLKGKNCGNQNGDPASVIIPPVEQGVNTSVFLAINTITTTEHYTNIVASNGAVSRMLLDGASIESNFTVTSSGYAYARLSVSPGPHILSCDRGGFLAWFYGLGDFESYAYIAGAAIRNLTESLYIHGLNTRVYTGSFIECQGDTVPMWVMSENVGAVSAWLIDSTQVAADIDTLHYIFDIPGEHLVQTVINSCDTLSAVINVRPTTYTTLVDTTCFNQPYNWHGHIFNSAGIYYDTLFDSYRCDSILVLNLDVIPRPDVAVNQDVDCHEATYSLTADLMGLNGYPFSWSSTPHDPLLNGHEHDTVVTVRPTIPTLYSLYIDCFCPFNEIVSLAPIEWPDAAVKISPQILTYEHPWLDAYDQSRHVMERQWIVNQVLQDETGGHLHYFASVEEDSVEVMLVLNGSTCPDTLLRIVPISHAAHWAPNIFTPDLESNNLFHVVLNEGVAEELYIYNRNGALVCHIEGANPVWDGTRDGADCPQGTYVWMLRYHTLHQPDQHIMLAGAITLLR